MRRPPDRKLDIQKLLGRLGIEARKKGREWWARCPNKGHEDRNPSWHIRDDLGSEKHGAMKCFSCDFGGGPLDLVEHVLALSRAEARDWLDEAPGAVDRRPVADLVEVRVAKSDRFKLPPGVEFGPIESWPESVRRYAVGRGIAPWQVDRWGIGYAVSGPLAGRLVFVKRTREGKVGGYSARTFVDDRKRYDEPGAWDRAIPGLLFGEERWPSPKERRRVHLAEGAINALAIERVLGTGAARLQSVVSTSGSDLSTLGAYKLSTWQEVVVVSDPDLAGDKLEGMVRAALSRYGNVVSRVRLPPGKDAASVPPEQLSAALAEIEQEREGCLSFGTR